MLDFAAIRIQPLAEDAFNDVFESAGGRREHSLDDKGLRKAERQAKLVGLFTAERPAHVLDRRRIDLAGQLACDRAMDDSINVGLVGYIILVFYCSEGGHFGTVQVHTSVFAKFIKLR